MMISFEDSYNCLSLTQRDRAVAKHYFIEHKTLKEIGFEFNITNQRVLDIIARIKRKIAHYRANQNKETDDLKAQKQGLVEEGKTLVRLRN